MSTAPARPALTFEQSERLGAALADVFERMSNEELSAQYRAIEAGLSAWGVRITTLRALDCFLSGRDSLCWSSMLTCCSSHPAYEDGGPVQIFPRPERADPA